MKRIVITAAAFVLSLTIMNGPVWAASPAPAYSAVLGSNDACQFSLVTEWRKASVATVYAIWYLDGGFLATMQAPFTGPNAGIIMRGHTAIFNAGPFAMTSTDHEWKVLVQFYGSGGEYLTETWSNADLASCAVTAD